MTPPSKKLNVKLRSTRLKIIEAEPDALNDHGVCARGTLACKPARGPTPHRLTSWSKVPSLLELKAPNPSIIPVERPE
jgi:hypothetical protein